MSKRALFILCAVLAAAAVTIIFAFPTTFSTAESVANALGRKYSKPASSYSIVVTADTGKFARGTVQFTDEPGGGVWFAAKTTSGWQLAFDGNGIIPCDVANKYEFPNNLVPQCIDAAQNNAIVQRMEINFSKDGNVTKDSPGFNPGVWYLSYEEPGKPGLSVALDLNSVSSSYISLTQGERVHVTGTLSRSVVTVQSITPITAEPGTDIKLYFYNPALDQGPGGVQCSRNGLVAVRRTIPTSGTPLTESIKLLLRGEISDEEQREGITSEFPLSGVTLTSASIENGIATLRFSDPQNKTSGGSCRVSILWAQIEATAKQFPTVTSVRFQPEELFQP
jgi:hypothetical protein